MDLRELHFGVEIETVRRTRKRVAEAIQSVVGGSVTHPGCPGVFDPWEVADAQGRTWKVVSDGSLSHVPSHLRAEVVTPVLAYGDIPTLEEVIRAVRKCGAKVVSEVRNRPTGQIGRRVPVPRLRGIDRWVSGLRRLARNKDGTVWPLPGLLSLPGMRLHGKHRVSTPFER